ncbi:hypothetical protein [Dyella subtropica]|uniref:hypothetical protein n=1 Tax=Dyella subtropica TaxID=2992127 RepID=UPI002250553C|nr:hypothetical protein [Dyella subtropica]
MSESEPKLDKLAWLSLAKPDSITVEELGLTSDEIDGACNFSNERVTFRNPEEATTRAIRHIQTAVIGPAVETPTALFEALHHCWLESGTARKDNLSGLALAQLHNSGQIDVLQIAVKAAQDGARGFSVSRGISESLPLLDKIDVPNLLILVGLVGPQGFLQHAAGEWMNGHPSSIGEVVKGCLAIPSEALAPLLRTALIQGVSVNRATWLARIHELVANHNPLVSMPAVDALGLLNWDGGTAEEIDKALEVVRAGLHSDDERQIVAATGAGLNLISTATDRHVLIDEIAALDKPYIARQIGDHLAYRVEHLKAQPWYLDKLRLLAAKANQEAGSYHGVDHILSGLYLTNQKDICLEWLRTWATTNSDASPSLSEELPQIFEALAKDDETLGALLARWLTSDDAGIQQMARKFLDDLGLHRKDDLRFPTSTLDALSPPGLLQLTRRVLANVLREEQKISLIWSLTHTISAESRTHLLVREAMASFVGYDYPVATIKHLETVLVTEDEAPIKKLAQDIREALKNYYDALDALPTIEELRPLSEHRHRFTKEHRRMMNAAFEEANMKSVFRQLVTTIHLKAGRSSFSMRNGEVGERMHMSAASHSVTLPRSESIDKVGSDLQRRQFILSAEPKDQ